MKPKKFSKRIIISQDGISPEKHELTAAHLLVQFFKADIVFIKRTSNQTPDFEINGTRWELKSPIGNGKRNIQHQLEKAFKQSPNIIFDARRSKIDMTKIKNELQKRLKMVRGIKRLILIDKDCQVVELEK